MVQTPRIAPFIHKVWEERLHVPVFETYGSTQTATDMGLLITHKEIRKSLQEE